MRILSIDMSSHTGWCILEDKKLITYGLLETPNPNPKGIFPFNIYNWAEKNVDMVMALINENPTEIIVIERTNLGRQRDSQSFLEYSHCLLWKCLKDLDLSHKIRYIDSMAWRKAVSLKLSEADKKQNKLVKDASKKGVKVVKVNDKRVGRINKKHLSVRLANSMFDLDLKLKNNNECDAILMGLSFFYES